MTAENHTRCSTRTAEAMLKIEESTGKRIDIVVMVQGDEPMVLPEMIDAVKKYLSGEKRRIDAIGELESLTGTLFLQCKDLMGGRWTNQMIAKGLEWKKTNEQEALESTLSKLVESGESI